MISLIRAFAISFVMLPVFASESHASEPLSPSDALKAFDLDETLAIALVAAEPTVIDPVAVAFDERGWMYVAEMRDYPLGDDSGMPLGRVALLEDKDGDGAYESRHEFASNLYYPNGVMCWDGGVFVTCAPDVLFLKDTDGDNIADVKRVVFTGFDLGNSSQLRVNDPTLGIDGWVYLATGLSGGLIVSPDYPEREPIDVRNHNFRFKPGTDQFERISGQSQFGLTFDEAGNMFIVHNRHHIRHVVLDARYLSRNLWLTISDTIEEIPDHGAAATVYPISENTTTAVSHAGTFTAACAVTVYEGHALGDDYKGNAFVCDPTGNLIHRDRLVPNGPTFIAQHADHEREFLRSTDNWFRPVFLQSGPDGALYVCDMYRKAIEHPRYLPDATREITDFESGKAHGRIYRIRRAGEQEPIQPFAWNGDATTLAQLFNHDDVWMRECAYRRLLTLPPNERVAVLRTLMEAPSRHVRAAIRAIYTLDNEGALNDEMLLNLLAVDNESLRETAVRLAEPRLRTSQALASKLPQLAGYPGERLRFRAALALGYLNDGRVPLALSNIMVIDLDERWSRTAVLSSLTVDTMVRFAELMIEAPRPDGEAVADLWYHLARMIAASQPLDEVSRVLDASLAVSTEAYWVINNLRGTIDGLRIRKPASTLQQLLENAAGVRASHLASVVQFARKVAADLAVATSLRVHAIELLGSFEADDTRAVLLQLIDPLHATEVQQAAVRALARFTRGGVAATLLERGRYRSYTPALRTTVLQTLVRIDRHVPVLFDAIEAGVVQSWAVPAVDRNRLLKHADEAIKSRADALFNQASESDRREVFEDYKSVLALFGDAVKGREMFIKHCAQCHQLDGQGTAVGPDLTGVRNQTPETLLLHILIPEHEMAPQFTNYVIETVDGEMLSGLIASESDTAITLRQPGGVESVVARDQIETMRASELSLMPQELEKAMTREELADLISYLKTPPKR